MELEIIETELKEKLKSLERLKELEEEEKVILNEISKLGSLEGTIVKRFIRCGKEGCKKCPHGPYYYLVRKVNGKTKWKYLGTELKADLRQARELKEKLRKIQKEKKRIMKLLKE